MAITITAKKTFAPVKRLFQKVRSKFRSTEGAATTTTIGGQSVIVSGSPSPGTPSAGQPGSFSGGGGGGGGGSGGGSAPSPTPRPIADLRGGGSQAPITIRETQTQQQLREAHLKAGFSQRDVRALERRAALKAEAIRRGRGFSRLEAQKFLGGGAGVSALREATRKGGKISRFEKVKKEKLEVEKREVKPRQVSLFFDGREVKEISGTREVFNIQTGFFETIKDDPGLAKGTREVISTRLPTEEERIKIEKREKDILTIPLKTLEKNIEESKKLQSQLTKLGDKNIVNEEWVGSETDLKKFNRLVDKFNTIDKTIKAGVGEGRFARQVSISGFDFKDRPVSSTSKVFSSIAGSVLGGVGEIVGETQQKIEKIPTVKIERKIQPFSFKASKPEIGRKAGEIIGEVGVEGGKFFIPVLGQTLFAAEVGEFGVGVGKTIKSGEKLTKEQKIELGITGAIVIGGGLFAGTRFLKKPIVVKESQNILRFTTRDQNFLGKRIRVSKDKGFQILPSKRGVIVERKVIEKPKVDLKAEETIGKDILEVSEKGTKETVLFPKQKLSQVSTEGSKVVVKKDGKIIFEGNPFTIKGKEQREKVFKLLKEEGLSQKEIRELIKLKQPVTTEQFLKGNILIKEKGAIGKFEVVRKQPVIELDEGIKTRGAKEIKTDIFIERRTIKDDGKKFILEEKGTQTFIKRKEGEGIIIKEERELSRGLIFGKTSGEQKGIEVIGEIKTFPKGSVILKEAQIQRIKGASIESKFILPKPEFRIDSSKTVLVKKEVQEVKDIGFQGGGKKSSKEFFEQLYFPQELKVVPKIPPVKIKTPKVKKIGLDAKKQEFPLVVGKTKFKESSFAGSKLFEGTEGGESLAPVQRGGQVMDVKIDTSEIVKEQPQVFDQVPITKQTELLKPISIEKAKEIQLFSPAVLQVPVTKQIEKLKEKQIEKQKEIQKTKQILFTSLLPKLEQKIIQKQRSELKEKIKSIIPFKLPSGDVKTKRIEKLKAEVFEAFGRRFGGDISLGKFKTKEKAKRELKEFLFETLGASGFIEKEGVKLKAEETSLLKEKEFRKGLLSDFLIVEKKEKRLKKGTGEVPEIQFFRKSPKGGKKGISLFGM